MFNFICKATSNIHCFFKKIGYKIVYRSKIKFGKHVKFRRGFKLYIDKKGKVVIGDNTFFNSYCSIVCFNKVTIGKKNLFGSYVTIYDHNHVFNKKEFNIKELSVGEVSIGDENWIATKVNICSNSKLGNRCVIAANINYANKEKEDFTLYKLDSKEKINIK